MSENSKNMTLEEKLVQNIKETTLGSLIGDEDAITELTKRALTEALFANRIRKGSYGDQISEPSPVITAAQELATKVLEAVFEEEYKKLFDDPEIRSAIQNAIVSLLPSILSGQVGAIIHHLNKTNITNTFTVLSQAFQDKGLGPVNFNPETMGNNR